jgi:hypothetical protein
MQAASRRLLLLFLLGLDWAADPGLFAPAVLAGAQRWGNTATICPAGARVEATRRDDRAAPRAAPAAAAAAPRGDPGAGTRHRPRALCRGGLVYVLLSLRL